jgi:hypothetical protein
MFPMAAAPMARLIVPGSVTNTSCNRQVFGVSRGTCATSSPMVAEP